MYIHKWTIHIQFQFPVDAHISQSVSVSVVYVHLLLCICSVICIIMQELGTGTTYVGCRCRSLGFHISSFLRSTLLKNRKQEQELQELGIQEQGAVISPGPGTQHNRQLYALYCTIMYILLMHVVCILQVVLWKRKGE